MKKILISLSVAFIVVLNTSGQSVAGHTPGCPLDNATLSGKTDTIQVKATYISIGKISQAGLLKKLEKQKKLKSKDFTYAIEFQPDNCTKKYYMPCRDKEKMATLAGIKDTKKPLYLTCVRFKGYEKYYGEPFFIITKVTYK